MHRGVILLTAAMLLMVAFPATTGQPGTAPGSCLSEPPHVVESWDGTELAVEVFVPDGEGPFPLIVRAHGYANQRERPADSPLVRKLVRDGAMVLTWDARGFGQSGGESHFDAPGVEGRDVLALIAWVNATSPYAEQLARDASGDPVVGLSGASYGGGVQWSALVADRILGPRPGAEPTATVDALAPQITWSNLSRAAIPGGVPKAFIDALIVGSGEVSARIGGAPPPADRVCPNTEGSHAELLTVVAEGFAHNGPTPATRSYLGARSIATFLDHPDLTIPPTFLVQGLRDTTLPPNQAIEVFESIRDRTEARMMIHATGHGWSGVPDQRDGDLRAWFNHTLHGEDLPPRLADHDVVYARDGRVGEEMGTDMVYADWDQLQATPLVEKDLPAPVRPLATLPAPASYSDVTFFQGPIDDQQDPGRARTFDTPGTAVSWDLPTGGDGVTLTGTPRLSLTVETTSDELFLFGKLEDVRPDGRSEVIHHQVRPLAVRGAALDGPRTVTWNLTALSEVLPSDHTLRVTVATSDAMYAPSRSPGTTWISDGRVDLPVEDGGLGEARVVGPADG